MSMTRYAPSGKFSTVGLIGMIFGGLLGAFIFGTKHNTAHGTVEIDGIRYRAYIPPVWVKEHLDESGRLFPGTYKRYQAQTVQKARFKRFVPVYGNEDRPLVELG